ncbi:MAG: ABC transporter substrate-binding protein, partial [Solirubrobacteraceae bacterium]
MRYWQLVSAARRLLVAVVLLILAALALSACGGSSSTNANTSVTRPGLFGKLPPAGTPTHGGTITYGMINGSTTPNYIFPVVPSGDASTSNYSWQQIMYLPLYNNFPYGGSPGVNYSLSIANKPVFSDGDKTVTIQLKPGYKWNDGHPVDAQDLLFDIALIKVAVAESAANWSSFTPGYFPQSLASISATGPNTVVMHLKRAFNPNFFVNNQLALNLYPLPSRSWNVTSPHGPHLNWKVPANAKKIYDYLGKAGGQEGTFSSNPLWKIADGPYKLQSFSPVTSSWTVTANPSLDGSPKPYAHTLQGV